MRPATGIASTPAELWIWQAGAPLMLRRSPGEDVVLGPDIDADEMPHAVVQLGAWQAARSLGAWSLCCCVVTPAFRFEGFELAPPEWEPRVAGWSRRGEPS